jgi:hypothetical protein
VFCRDLLQKWVAFIVVLLFVFCEIFFDCKPQGVQLWTGGAVLNLIGNGIEPMLQSAVTDELAAFIGAMDEDDICPAFNSHDQVFGNF